MTPEWLSSLESVLNDPLFHIGDQAVTLMSLLVTAVIIGATFALAWLAERGLERALNRRAVLDPGTVAVVGRLVYYAAAVTGLGIALHTLGVNLSALFAAGAVFAVGLGFGLQNLVQNFISGVILLGERTIKPGDVLDVENMMVRVEHMGLRATIARNLDEEQIILPNSVLVQTTVKNLTLRDRLFRLRTTVGVSYSSDLDRVFEVLTAAAKEHEGRNQERDPVVLLLGFGSSSVDFEVSIWLDDPWRAKLQRSRLNLLIWNGLKTAGIVISFPQVDVHFDAPVVSAWSGSPLAEQGSAAAGESA